MRYRFWSHVYRRHSKWNFRGLLSANEKKKSRNVGIFAFEKRLKFALQIINNKFEALLRSYDIMWSIVIWQALHQIFFYFFRISSTSLFIKSHVLFLSRFFLFWAFWSLIFMLFQFPTILTFILEFYSFGKYR